VKRNLIDTYIKRVEENKRLHYEIYTQNEFQNNLINDINRLKKENEELQKSNIKKIASCNNKTDIYKHKLKCPPSEVYKFDNTSKNDIPLNKRQILLNKLRKMKKISSDIKNSNKNIYIDNITTDLSSSNQKLFNEINTAL